MLVCYQHLAISMVLSFICMVLYAFCIQNEAEKCVYKHFILKLWMISLLTEKLCVSNDICVIIRCDDDIVPFFHLTHALFLSLSRCLFVAVPDQILKCRRDHANARIPRSSSIDSMVEAVWSETPRPSLTLSPPPQTTSQPTPQYLQINYGNTGSISRRESLLSPSAGRRAKQQRYIAGK